MNLKLFEAITQNDQLLFKQLLDEEGDSILDERTENSLETTLHLACKHGHAKIVHQIVVLRPDLVKAHNQQKETPLLDACRGGNLEVLETLLEAKPWVFHQSNCKSALLLACEHGHGHLMRRLMSEMNSVETVFFSLSSNFAAEFSCLRITISRGYAEVIRELIEACPILVERSDEDGLNLLHYACELGEPDIARILLISNPNLAQSYDNHGFAPLHHAVMRNKIAIFKEFEAFAPSAFKILTKKQETIFHLAVQTHQFDAFVSLIQVLGDSNDLFYRRDQDGNRLLHLAIYHNSVEIAEYLISKATKQQLQTRNYVGLTALGFLEKSGLEDVAALHLKDLLLKKLHKFNPNTKSASDNEISQQDEELNEDQSQMVQLTETLSDIETRTYKSKLQEVTIEHKVDKVLSRKSSSTSSSSRTVYQGCRGNASYQRPLYKAVKTILTTIKAEKGVRKDIQKKRMYEMHMEGLQNARNTINIIAILIATVTFTGCLSPPGGFFQEGANIGKPVLSQTTAFKVFLISNDVALFLSLGIVVILVSIIPFRTTPMRRVLTLTHKLLWLAVFFLAIAYIAARWATTLQVKHLKRTSKIVLSICGGFLCIIFVGLSIMLIKNKLETSKLRKKENLTAGTFSFESNVLSRVTSGYITY
ncbi:ankyrin repeat-containing protein At5g02620-like [Chenopodium quinoa]|uniref:ankyrin repeat-containing protein At5g02620-like n=1 Tax=Chenopodium quinoa TaxID=63459 RepID=UPI000B774F78|nr:ankyrin repeat-containing protein At5g02620-like [Chenopodium quinoa]